MEPRIPIRKIDAATRQLDTAISLLFEKRDLVSVHTLAAAAAVILHDILGSMNRPRIIDYIVESRQAEFLRAVRKAQNFFKHADKDPEPNGQLDFSPVQTHMMLFEACFHANALNLASTPERECFLLWYLLEYPEVVKWELAPQQLKDLQEAIRPDFDPLDPHDFDLWKQLVELRHKQQGARPPR